MVGKKDGLAFPPAADHLARPSWLTLRGGDCCREKREA